MRLKGLLFLLISFFFIQTTRSQSNELIVKGQTGKLYLEHTVVAKENWYSIGRLYNISPKEIAPFNNLTLDKSLSIGEQVQIPLTAGNFSQDKQKTAAESLVPLYYIIQEKEWMYRISVNHNKVPIPELEKWNNITGDQVKAGMPIIIGFLKVKTALSALANGVTGAPVASVPAGAAAATAAGAHVGAGTAGVSANPVDGTVPVGVAPVPAAPVPTPPAGASNKTPTTTVPNGAGSVSAVPGVTSPAAASMSSAGSTDAPAATSKPADVGSKPADAHPAINFNGGYFKNDFSNTGNAVSGLAGTFKSTSGWKDGKYYALMNGVPVGTIVRITIPATGKNVCAKVLGQLPEMKESAGLAIRVSNAAAGELGAGDGRFAVEVKY